ncbi:hypothetical protein [Salipiger mucosus]|uniref:Excalibur calcium-binding domain-containing protein n=1 Tax=Salipiger mucosus DSM 16094 TaxID=1123237 RepID=S9QZZ0_9RHOB|nr:hypothetical protein [Salipiger mucosus]EPX85152.1 hypothetical protein Salmuc_01108 [Salipiger mucosus DSM 16094]
MNRLLLCGVAALALASCAPAVPDSGSGVGFEDYDTYNDRKEATAQRVVDEQSGAVTVQSPTEVESATLDADGNAEMSSPAPAAGQPPQAVTNSVGISSENDFEAVSAERDIEADAALIEQNRAQYQVVSPRAVPNRPGTDRPNIVQFALQTNNAVGQPLYDRSGFNAENRQLRACAEFPSSDLAQEEFLAQGGPERDRRGMDPDGDGFACDWDPAPFRAVRGG